MANTWYISGTGNDSTGTGSSGNPWQTISKAVSSSGSGDTIIILTAGGSISWVNQSFNVGLLTIKAQGSGLGTLDGGGVAGSIGAIQWNFATNSSIFLTGLRFTNGGYDSTGSDILFSDSFGGGTTNDKLTFTQCQLDNITFPKLGSIAQWGSGSNNTSVLTFNRCLFYNNFCQSSLGNIGMVAGRTGGGSQLIINNCTFSGPTSGAYPGGYASRMVFIDNSNVGGTQVGLLNNNIFYDNTGTNPVLLKVAGGQTFTGQNNLHFGDSSFPTGSMTGTLNTDPLLVDPSNSNFALRPTSPCIDAGVLL